MLQRSYAVDAACSGLAGHIVRAFRLVDRARLFLRSLTAIADPAGHDHADKHEQRHEVDELDQPVARVSEDDHIWARPAPARAGTSGNCISSGGRTCSR